MKYQSEMERAGHDQEVNIWTYEYILYDHAGECIFPFMKIALGLLYYLPLIGHVLLMI